MVAGNPKVTFLILTEAGPIVLRNGGNIGVNILGAGKTKGAGCWNTVENGFSVGLSLGSITVTGLKQTLS